MCLSARSHLIRTRRARVQRAGLVGYRESLNCARMQFAAICRQLRIVGNFAFRGMEPVIYAAAIIVESVYTTRSPFIYALTIFGGKQFSVIS